MKIMTYFGYFFNDIGGHTSMVRDESLVTEMRAAFEETVSLLTIRKLDYNGSSDVERFDRGRLSQLREDTS